MQNGDYMYRFQKINAGCYYSSLIESAIYLTTKADYLVALRKMKNKKTITTMIIAISQPPNAALIRWSMF